MTVKNFILFVLLGFSGLLNAELPANISPAPIESPCNLPAPTNFQVVNLGSTWVDLTWIPSVPGSWHRIKTFETVSGNLVSNILVPPGGLVQRVDGLQANTDYTSKINTVCSDGSDSDLIDQLTFQTIIVDLTVLGYEQGASVGVCTLQVVGQTCTFPMNGKLTGFMVRSRNNPAINRRFSIGKNTNPNSTADFTTGLKKDNFGEAFVFQINGQNPYVIGNRYQIKYQDQLVVEYDLYQSLNQNMGVITCTMLNPDFEIIRFFDNSAPGSGGGAFNGGSIGALEESHTLVANTMPNPFSDQLNVQLEQFSEAPVQLSLFNLNGQRVLDQSFTGGSETYTLNTAQIPAGFYLLRVDYNGEVQTVKVVKTQ